MHTNYTDLNKIQRLAGKAVGDFNLIEKGDRVLVALSGGKDSWALLHILQRLQRKAPIDFSLHPATIHPGFTSFHCEKLSTGVANLGFNLHIEYTRNAEIITQNIRSGTSYCAFCARLRRGVLYSLAKRLQCNKIALGHHLDDFIETLLLNQFFSGALAAMSPKMLADNGTQQVIRPLVYVEEALIQQWIKNTALPLIGCGCPEMGLQDQNRQKIKALLAELELKIPTIKKSMRNAMGNIQTRHLLDSELNAELQQGDKRDIDKATTSE